MKNKKTMLAVVALVAVAAILVGWYLIAQPQIQWGSKTFTLEVKYADGTVNTTTYTTTEEYVGTVLEAEGRVSGTYDTFGLYIHEVDGQRAVYEEDGAYWALYINGETAMQGISLTPALDGYVYRLEYTPADGF